MPGARPLRFDPRRRYGGDLHGGAARSLADAPRGFDSVHDRHSDIHPDEVGTPRPELLHRFRPVVDHFHAEPGVSQQPFEQHPVFGLILDDQDPVGGLSWLYAHNALAVLRHGRHVPGKPRDGNLDVETRPLAEGAPDGHGSPIR